MLLVKKLSYGNQEPKAEPTELIVLAGNPENSNTE